MHFSLSDTMLWGESEGVQHAAWYLSGQDYWTFWTNTTIICLAFFKKDCFFSFDWSADYNEDFVAMGSFINSHERRFSEFERFKLNNSNWNWPDPKRQAWLLFSLSVENICKSMFKKGYHRIVGLKQLQKTFELKSNIFKELYFNKNSLIQMMPNQ